MSAWLNALQFPRESRRNGQAMDRVSSMLSFVKVVDTGGFGSAARQLNLSASVVTTRVKSIEERLGVRLLNCTTRSVSLTEAGRAYYDRCVQIFRRSRMRKKPRKCFNRSREVFCGSTHRQAFRG